MSSNNNDNSGTVAIAFVIAIIGMAMLFFYALGLFLAFVFTILSIMAWDKPLTIGKITITPDEAHAFVGRGIAGAILVPTFCAFCSLVFQVHIEWDLLPHMILGGYMLGSIGVEVMMADQENASPNAGSPPVTYIMPEPQAPRLPSPQHADLPEGARFNPYTGAPLPPAKHSGPGSLTYRMYMEQLRAEAQETGEAGDSRFASWDDEEELRR